MVYTEGTAYAYLQARPFTTGSSPLRVPAGRGRAAGLGLRWPNLPGGTDHRRGRQSPGDRCLRAVDGDGTPREWRSYSIVATGPQIFGTSTARPFRMPRSLTFTARTRGTSVCPWPAGQFLLNYGRVFFSFVPWGNAQAVGIDGVEPGRKFGSW